MMIFLKGMAFTFLSILYVTIFIRDTRGPHSEFPERQSYDFIGAFSIWNVIEVFKTCFKSRDNYVRSILLLLISAMLYNMSTICKYATYSVFYLPYQCHFWPLSNRTRPLFIFIGRMSFCFVF